MMNIRNLTLARGLVLAPMAGVTDRTFRLLCREQGCDMTVTEMVSAKALHYHDKKTDRLAALGEGEHPAAVQIFGSEPEIMAEAAQILLSRPNPPDLIDINMGCPMKKIVSNHEGSYLLREPRLAASIVRAVKDAVTVPVTVKMRIGWDEGSICADEFARVIADAGADALTVHGRTREQMYAPGVNLAAIAAVKKAVSIPVIGNGDIFSPEDADRMRRSTGVDGIAIGRGSMGNPWLFSRIVDAMEGRSPKEPTIGERIQMALRQLDGMIEEKGERVGLNEGRRLISYYIAGIRASAAARDAIHRAEDRDTVERILRQLEEESERDKG